METRTYPCGVSATGEATLPAACPEHKNEFECGFAAYTGASVDFRLGYNAAGYQELRKTWKKTDTRA